MSAVWISKDSWEKVWNALHNIQVRQNFAVQTPCATLSGNGSSARLNIDLPGTAASSGDGSAAYDGFFKLIAIDEEVEVPDDEGEGTHMETLHRIAVADGATWEPAAETSGPGQCFVDNALFEVDAWISEPLDDEVYPEQPVRDKIAVLKYTPFRPAAEACGTEGEEDYQPPVPEIPAGVTVELLDEIPIHPNRILYHPLGRVFLTYDTETESTSMEIQQDHTSGAVFMEAYYSGMFACDLEMEEGEEGPQFWISVSEGTLSVMSKSFHVAPFEAEFTGAGGIYLVYNPEGFEPGEGEEEPVYARIEYSASVPAYSCIMIGNVSTATTEGGTVFPLVTQQQKDDFFLLLDMDVYTGDFAVHPTEDGVVVRAGSTDIGNLDDTEFGEDANGKSIYLIGLSDGTDYSVELYCGDEEPESEYKSFPIQIATVDSSGIPHQVWKSGSIRFADLYLL